MQPPDQPDDTGPIDWAAGGIETELGWSLHVVVQGFLRAGSVAVGPVPGGPRGYQVLVAVTTEAPASQLLLGQRLGIDKNAMTAVIDALESQGYVERRPDPTDRRVRQVLPTVTARTLLRTARSALHDVELTLMRSLDAESQQHLRRLLARVALDISGAEAPAAQADESGTPIAAPHRSDRRSLRRD